MNKIKQLTHLIETAQQRQWMFQFEDVAQIEVQQLQLIHLDHPMPRQAHVLVDMQFKADADIEQVVSVVYQFCDIHELSIPQTLPTLQRRLQASVQDPHFNIHDYQDYDLQIIGLRPSTDTVAKLRWT